jgi:hypothetical protein
LLSFDVHKEYGKSKRVYADDSDFLKISFEASFGIAAKPLTQVEWFHCTRTPLKTDFSEGLLPLHLVRSKLWEIIISIIKDPATKANLITMKEEGVSDFQYNLKMSELHSGPYAILIRECLFHTNLLGIVNYLELPETVEDICNGYLSAYGHDITKEVSNGLNKCIVKFQSTKEVDEFLIGVALMYCWCKANFAELSRSVIANFDAKGEVIPQKDIKNIEFI